MSSSPVFLFNGNQFTHMLGCGTPCYDSLVPVHLDYDYFEFDEESDDDDIRSPTNPDNIFKLYSLTDVSKVPIPSSIIRSNSSWDDADKEYKIVLEKKKEADRLAPFLKFNQKKETEIEAYKQKMFMDSLPTMSKAFKERLMREKEEDIKRKMRASDQFYNKGRPSSTSQTAWGHRRNGGGKGKVVTMTEANSQKTADEVAARRRERRAATKMANLKDDEDRVAHYKHVEEIKKRFEDQQLAEAVVVEDPVPETEVAKFRREEIEEFRKKQLEVFANEVPMDMELIDKVTVEKDLKWKVVENVKKVIKEKTMVTDIMTSLFGKSSSIPRRETTPMTSNTAAVGQKCTRVCKSVIDGINCKYGDKCQFAHSIEQLNVVACGFGGRCRNVRKNRLLGWENTNGVRMCQFIHPGEVNSSFCQRIGVNLPTSIKKEFVNVSLPVPTNIPTIVEKKAPTVVFNKANPWNKQPTKVETVKVEVKVEVETAFSIKRCDLRKTMETILEKRLKKVHITFLD